VTPDLDRRPSERGSVLMLVPAGILVLLTLAAIAIDSSVVFLAQRDLADRTAAVAGDIANAAVNDDALYDGGRVELRADTAAAYVGLAFDPAHPPQGYERWDAAASVSGREVTVSAEAEVRPIFARAIPGVARTFTVRAQSTADAVGSGP
jgi:hypothetical protein